MTQGTFDSPAKKGTFDSRAKKGTFDSQAPGGIFDIVLKGHGIGVICLMGAISIYIQSI